MTLWTVPIIVAILLVLLDALFRGPIIRRYGVGFGFWAYWYRWMVFVAAVGVVVYGTIAGVWLVEMYL